MLFCSAYEGEPERCSLTYNKFASKGNFPNIARFELDIILMSARRHILIFRLYYIMIMVNY